MLERVVVLIKLSLAHQLGHHGVHLVLSREDVATCHFLVLLFAALASFVSGLCLRVGFLFFFAEALLLLFEPFLFLAFFGLGLDLFGSLLPLLLEEEVDYRALHDRVA